MKTVIFGTFLFAFSLVSRSQTVVNGKYSCSPKDNINSVFKVIGGDPWEKDLGTSWSFIGTQKIVTKDGVTYLKGDIYSPRGGKLNVIQNGWDKPVYILYKEWDCL
jgi:hypothetical protein